MAGVRKSSRNWDTCMGSTKCWRSMERRMNVQWMLSWKSWESDVSRSSHTLYRTHPWSWMLLFLFSIPFQPKRTCKVFSLLEYGKKQKKCLIFSDIMLWPTNRLGSHQIAQKKGHTCRLTFCFHLFFSMSFSHGCVWISFKTVIWIFFRAHLDKGKVSSLLLFEGFLSFGSHVPFYIWQLSKLVMDWNIISRSYGSCHGIFRSLQLYFLDSIWA